MPNKVIVYDLGQHPTYKRPCIFLKFDYSEPTIEAVKTTINSLRYSYSVRFFYPSHQAGGWLKDLKCWFVDYRLWDEFQATMQQDGYYFYSVDEWEAHESYYQRQSNHHNHSNNNSYQNTKTAPAKCNIFVDWLKIGSNNQVGLHTAYKDLALLLHPDRQQNEKLRRAAEDLMKRINSDFDEFRKAKAS